MLKTILVLSIIHGIAIAFLFTLFNDPNYIQGLKQSAEIITKHIGVKP